MGTYQAFAKSSEGSSSSPGGTRYFHTIFIYDSDNIVQENQPVFTSRILGPNPVPAVSPSDPLADRNESNRLFTVTGYDSATNTWQGAVNVPGHTSGSGSSISIFPGYTNIYELGPSDVAWRQITGSSVPRVVPRNEYTGSFGLLGESFTAGPFKLANGNYIASINLVGIYQFSAGSWTRLRTDLSLGGTLLPEDTGFDRFSSVRGNEIWSFPSQGIVRWDVPTNVATTLYARGGIRNPFNGPVTPIKIGDFYPIVVDSDGGIFTETAHLMGIWGTPPSGAIRDMVYKLDTNTNIFEPWCIPLPSTEASLEYVNELDALYCRLPLYLRLPSFFNVSEEILFDPFVPIPFAIEEELCVLCKTDRTLWSLSGGVWTQISTIPSAFYRNLVDMTTFENGDMVFLEQDGSFLNYSIAGSRFTSNSNNKTIHAVGDTENISGSRVTIEGYNSVAYRDLPQTITVIGSAIEEGSRNRVFFSATARKEPRGINQFRRWTYRLIRDFSNRFSPDSSIVKASSRNAQGTLIALVNEGDGPGVRVRGPQLYSSNPSGSEWSRRSQGDQLNRGLSGIDYNSLTFDENNRAIFTDDAARGLFGISQGRADRFASYPPGCNEIVASVVKYFPTQSISTGFSVKLSSVGTCLGKKSLGFSTRGIINSLERFVGELDFLSPVIYSIALGGSGVNLEVQPNIFPRFIFNGSLSSISTFNPINKVSAGVERFVVVCANTGRLYEYNDISGSWTYLFRYNLLPNIGSDGYTGLENVGGNYVTLRTQILSGSFVYSLSINRGSGWDHLSTIDTAGRTPVGLGYNGDSILVMFSDRINVYTSSGTFINTDILGPVIQGVSGNIFYLEFSGMGRSRTGFYRYRLGSSPKIEYLGPAPASFGAVVASSIVFLNSRVYASIRDETVYAGPTQTSPGQFVAEFPSGCNSLIGMTPA